MFTIDLLKESFLHARVDIKDVDKVSSEVKGLDLASHGHGFRILDLQHVTSSMPVLWQWFRSVNALPSRVCCINIKAGSSQQPHIDTGPMDLALNIPVSGCLGAHTLIFENKGQVVIGYTKNTNLTFSKYIDENPSEISRFVLDSPMLINIKIPHQVVNDSNQDRICLSFRFTPDPWHLVDKGTFWLKKGATNGPSQ